MVTRYFVVVLASEPLSVYAWSAKAASVDGMVFTSVYGLFERQTCTPCTAPGRPDVGRVQDSSLPLSVCLTVSWTRMLAFRMDVADMVGGGVPVMSGGVTLVGLPFVVEVVQLEWVVEIELLLDDELDECCAP